MRVFLCFRLEHSFLILWVVLHASTSIIAQTPNPPHLDVNALETNYLFLKWTNYDLYNRYHTERKSSADSWNVVAEIGEATSFIDRDVVVGVTCSYRIEASTPAALSTYSNEASVPTVGMTLQPPAAPNLTADVSFNNIHLRWIPTEGVTEYQIESMDTATPWHEIVTLGGNSSNYLITPLIEGMTYHFRIRAFNDAGISPYSTLPISAPYDPSIIPPAPTIYASPRTDKSITLQWNFVPRAWGYVIESRTSPSVSWVRITNVGREVTFFVHENLRASTDYFYRILAYNGAGDSEYSAEATTSTYPPPPSSPQLRGIPTNYKEIEFQWTDVLTNCCTVNGFIGYRLERWNGLGWVESLFLGVDDTNYFVDNLQPSTEYTYRIEALHPLSSGWSTNTVRTMDPPPIPPPTAPTFFADPHSSTSIQLKWFDVYLETEYRIERENFPGGGVWQQTGTVPADSTSYLDTNLQPATLYVYRIRAANPFGASSYSHETAARTRPPPEVPALEVGATSSTEVYVLVRPAENATLHRLERLNANGQWDLIYEKNSAPFNIPDTGLTVSTPYTYRVGALSPAGTWHYSAIATTQTLPLEFTATVRPLSSSAIELSWQHLPYVEHFYIQGMTNGIWDWRNVIELDGTATNHVITGLSADTSYTYRVYAANRFGRSPESQVTIKTLDSISGDIVIRAITPADFGAIFRLRLTGSTGRKFKAQGTTDFKSWRDLTETLTLSADMVVGVPSIGNAGFYRTIKVD